MSAVRGIWRNGQVLLEVRANWPEGSPVLVEPISSTPDLEMNGDLQSDDPDALAKWLAEFDAIPPWEITSKEEEIWQADRRALKEYTVARMKNISATDLE